MSFKNKKGFIFGGVGLIIIAVLIAIILTLGLIFFSKLKNAAGGDLAYWIIGIGAFIFILAYRKLFFKLLGVI